MNLFDQHDPPDPCANRHGGVAESQAAWERARPTVSEAHVAIVAALREAGPDGLTCKEYVVLAGKRDGRDYGANHFSGRFTELRQAGRIARNGARRDGAAVWVLVR